MNNQGEFSKILNVEDMCLQKEGFSMFQVITICYGSDDGKGGVSGGVNPPFHFHALIYERLKTKYS